MKRLEPPRRERLAASRDSLQGLQINGFVRAGGVPSYLIDDETEIEDAWFDPSIRIVGITSGASAPEKLVQRVCTWFRDRGVTAIEEHRFLEEDIEFRLPVELRRELALADAQS